jgi:hypothetical protein
MNKATRLTTAQKAALTAATFHPAGLVYIGSIYSATLAVLIREGLMDLVSEYGGKPTCARLTAAGRTRGGAR